MTQWVERSCWLVGDTLLFVHGAYSYCLARPCLAYADWPFAPTNSTPTNFRGPVFAGCETGCVLNIYACVVCSTACQAV